MHTFRSTPKEIALLNKLDRLAVSTHRTVRLRQFDLSNSCVLSWNHSVTRGSRRYSMQCNLDDDGVLNVSFSGSPTTRRALRMPKAKRFPGQLLF